MLKVGIIGCAGHYGLAIDSADKYNTCSIAAVASANDSTDDTSLRIVAEKRGIPFYADWRQMLETEKPDIAEVDNRYDRHAAVSAACLERGCSVYCEKPLATAFSDLEMLKNAWKASGKALGGMFNLRWTGWFLGVKQAIEAGEIGKVRLIHAQKSYKFGTRPEFFRHRDMYGGLIPWVAIHALDWCLALGGKCLSVSALQSAGDNRGCGETEMSAVIQMELENEVFATVSADYFRPQGAARHDDDRIRVTGTKGMIEVIDGVAWLENDRPRRAISLPEPGDAFGEFIKAVEAGTAERFALDAIESTRIALLAREAGDLKRTLRTD
ncbi:MAG: Gfo/Idh/MocA family oxidoreductase [Clostridiales bacterium]|nr:Gfo/Idh/MocA family oxidoreductase [Clostridiales bacterium]